jgi:hypothetical protein
MDSPLSIRSIESEFALFGGLVAKVPVYRLYPHQDPARIGRLCELIESHLRRPA